jgi:type VI secretion system protein ImpF
MADLSPQERLQPSLLDRLADDEPEKLQESRERRILSMQKLRGSVLRDLAWLMNAINLASSVDLSEFPLAAHSVVNFGLPDLAGRAGAALDVHAFERMLQQTIWDFEPRILRNSLEVRLVRNDDRMDSNALAFEIQGELWGQPLPVRVFLKTEIDLDIGEVRVSDYSGAGAR